MTKHDDVFMLDGEGMPTVGNPFVKGRLFVIFKVSAPYFFSIFSFTTDKISRASSKLTVPKNVYAV